MIYHLACTSAMVCRVISSNWWANNFPTRLSYNMSKEVNSRVATSLETLLGTLCLFFAPL